MFRMLAAALLAVVATAAAARLIIGHYPHEGPFVSISATHGIHVGDLAIMAVWALLLWAAWRWVRKARPTEG